MDTRSSHRWTTLPANWDPLNLEIQHQSDNHLGIPALRGSATIPSRLIEHGNRYLRDRVQPGAAVHYFIDDYRFEPCWKNPLRALDFAEPIGCSLTPDFSMFADMPPAMQIWNTYRKHWIGSTLEVCGLEVIPTISWTDEHSYHFCFLGVPQGSVVAVSGLGIRDPEGKRMFAAGFRAMLDRRQPAAVLSYGRLDRYDIPRTTEIREYPTRWESIKAG